MKKILVYMKETGVTVLGPGRRYVLWVQGCHQNCPGCIALSSHQIDDGREISTGALAAEISLSQSDGLTISGGEPFLQAEALCELIDKIKRHQDMGIIVYTGYLYEDLLKDERSRALLSRIDLLIDGPYVKALDDGLSLRGSSNQRVIPLTDRYINDLSLYGTSSRQTQSMNYGSEIHNIGIPDENYGGNE